MSKRYIYAYQAGAVIVLAATFFLAPYTDTIGKLAPFLAGFISAAILTVLACLIALRESRHLIEELDAAVRESARSQLDTAKTFLRPTLEDLRSRDPQLAETMDLALIELASKEPTLTALARGDWREARRLHRRRETDG